MNNPKLAMGIMIVLFWHGASVVILQADPPQPDTTPVSAAMEMQNKNEAMQHFQQGKNFQQRKLYQGAIQEFRKALMLDPGWEEAKMALNWAKQDWKLSQQLEAKPNLSLPDLIKKAQVFYERGRRLEAENNLIDAAIAYKEAIATLAEFPEAKTALYRVQNKAGIQPGAADENSRQDFIRPNAKQINELWNKKPKRTKLPRAIIRSHGYKTMPKKTSAQAPDSKVTQAVQMHYLNGSQSLDSGDYATAISEFQLILEFVPDHKGALYKLDQARKKRDEELAAAREKIEKASETGDTASRLKALHDMSVMDPENKKIAEAWEQARKQNQELVEKLYREGVDLYARENYAEAMKKWELALNLNPHHKKSLESIKQVREKLLLISNQKD